MEYPQGSQGTRLDSWKEIAAYLGVAERTAKRWETARDLPVHRLPGGAGRVFSFSCELDQWLLGTESKTGFEDQALSSPETTRELPGAADGVPEVRGTGEDNGLRAAPPSGEMSDGAILYGFAPSMRTLFLSISTIALVLGVGLYRFSASSDRQAHIAVRAESRAALSSRSADTHYLEAMYLLEKREPPSLLKAQHLMNDMVASEPANASAWSALAHVDLQIRNFDVDKSKQIEEQTRDAAVRAIALDPALSEPHAVLGFIDCFWARKTLGQAESEFREAIRLDPQSAFAHSWYGIMLTGMARFPEALRELDTAASLEPSSAAIIANRAMALGLSGSRDEAVRQLRAVGGNNPPLNIRYDLSVLATVEPRDPHTFVTERLEICQATHELKEAKMYVQARLILQHRGEAAMWRFLANPELSSVTSDVHIAEAQAAIGEKMQALRTLSDATQRGNLPVGLDVDPLLLPLHDSLQFQDILAQQLLTSL